MTNLQLYLALIIPSVLVLVGILLNRSDLSTMRSDMTALRSEMRSDNAALRSEMRSDNAALRSEMVQLRDSIHHDMVSLHERIAVVEAKHT